MFIEKYQPYTSLIITYDGGELSVDNPFPLPAVITGEYKVNLDAIGYDEVDVREALPFTRNDITWWLIDNETGELKKEVDLDDGNGTKFTIDDSGTVSLTSVYYMAGEGDVLGVTCVLGQPSASSIQELDPSVDIFTYLDFPFAEGGGGGGGETTFPTFTNNNDNWSCDLTYAQTYDVMLSDGVGEDGSIPCIISNTSWAVAYYYPNDAEMQEIFPDIPETVNYVFWVSLSDNHMIICYADDGNIYTSTGPK